MDMGVYGDRLRARARALGLTDAEVARRLGLAQSRYANYVNGNREPDLATFARICRALATTPDEILGFGAESAEAERRRALAAIETMDRSALKIAAVVLEAIAARQDELREEIKSFKPNDDSALLLPNDFPRFAERLESCGAHTRIGGTRRRSFARWPGPLPGLPLHFRQ